MRGNLPATMRDPRHLGRHRVVTNLRQPTRTANHQLCHRAKVPLVTLEPPQQLLRASFFHLRRVQLDDLDTSHPQPGNHRPVVMTRGLDPDPAQHRPAFSHLRLDHPHQALHTGLIEPELERRHRDLAVMISDQHHRRPLPDIDRHDQTRRRVHAPDPRHEPRLQLTTNETRQDHQPPVKPNTPR
jgi:hypothetical protein